MNLPNTRSVVVIVVIAVGISITMLPSSNSASAESRESAPLVGEPLTAELFDLYSGGSRDYIAETGRIVTHDNGTR